MLYNFVADSFHTKLCSRLSSSEDAILDRKRPFCVFEPPKRGLGATYDDHLRLIVKRVGDFLLVLIELFSLGIRLRRYEQLSVLNRRFRSNVGRLTQTFR